MISWFLFLVLIIFLFFSTEAIQDNFKLSCFHAFNMQLEGLIGFFYVIFFLFICLFYTYTKEHYCTSGNQAVIHMYTQLGCFFLGKIVLANNKSQDCLERL